jgi:hypothetical protein
VKMRKWEERRAAVVLRDAKPFDQIEPRAEHRRDVGCVARTFNPENPLDGILEVKCAGEKHALVKGKLRYLKLRVPMHEGLPISGGRDLYDGPKLLYFDAPIDIPVLQYQKAANVWEPWMSLTPMEMWTQRSGVFASTGHVVLGGLGMGWLLTQIAKKPTVKKITVVEQDQDLLDWFGYQVCKKIPKVDEVICGDFWEHAPKYDLQKCRYIADVWPKHGQAEYSERLVELRARGAKVWAWGSARPTDYQKHKIRQIRRGWDAAARAAAEGLGG